MGLSNTISGSRIYLDTNIFIYAIEGYPEYQSILTSLFRLFDEGTYSAVTSELTLAEVLIKPMKENKKEIQQLYEELLRPSDVLTICTIDRQILIDAAKIRASSDTILLPDAIHFASARNQNCSSFITNDKRLRKIDSFQVVILSEL